MRSVRDCRVAVVGGAGFLGSHLVDFLLKERGCEVLVLDNLCAGRRKFVDPAARFEHCDVTVSEDRMRKLFQGVRFVFQYASLPYVPMSFERPLHVLDVNLTGAAKVVNAAHEAGCEAILSVSSAEVYGEGGSFADVNDAESRGGKIDEEAAVAPHSSYGTAKAGIDFYCQAAWRERRTPVITLRQFNCYGPRACWPFVIPEIISQLTNPIRGTVKFPELGTPYFKPEYTPHPPVVKLGNDSQRDFQWCGDAVRDAVLLLEHGELGAVYNMGSEESVGIYDLARTIGGLMGFGSVDVQRDEARVRPWEIWKLRACCDKLYSVIPRGPRVSLEDGLRRTILWHEGQGGVWPWEGK